MIEANVVKIVRDPTHPVDPPRIPLFFHHVPAIKRTAPALSVFAEKIRGHTSDNFRIEFGVQAKQLGMSPDIGTVEIHEDGDVAHDTNGTLRAIGTKRLPLLEKEELHDAAHIEFLEHFGVRLLEGHWIAVGQFVGPSVPIFQLETRAQTVEKNKVVEPPLVLTAEALITRTGVRRSGAHEI